MRTRRQLLRTVGIGALAGAAGCVGSQSSPGTTNETASNATGTTGNETTTTNAKPDERFRLDGTTVVEDFEDLSAWSAASGSLEASDERFRGSQGMRITASKPSSGDAFAWATRSVDWDLSDETLSLAVNTASPVDNVVVAVRLLAPDTNNSLTMAELVRIRDDQGWMRLDLATRDFDGNPDLSSVSKVQLGMRAASGAIDFVVDDLRTVPRPDKGYVVLSFDDSLHSHYSEAFPTLKKHDMVGNVGTITGDVGSDGSLTLDQMTEMRDAGWEFASHATSDASLLDLSTQDTWLAVNDAHDWLTNHGFETGAKSFVYPHGEFDDSLVQFIGKYHDQAFRYLDPLSAGSGKITDPLTIGRGNAAYSLVDSKTAVNYAEHFHTVTPLTFHAIGNDGKGLSMATDAFEELVSYIDSRDVEVITFSELGEKLVLD